MELKWNQIGEKVFETGLDRGVLYIPDANGDYNDGVVWNGLTSVNRTFDGAQVTPYYIDGIKYLNVVSTEEFGAVLEAYTYPDEFAQFDGAAEAEMGFFINEQVRSRFGLAYRTQVGNDIDGQVRGYKLHLIYGAVAIPTEQNFLSFGDSPEATVFSWDISATPISIPGFKPAASVMVDSTKADGFALYELERILYGTGEIDPRLPFPDEIADFLVNNANPDVIFTENNKMLTAEDDGALLKEGI